MLVTARDMQVALSCVCLCT